MYRYRKTFSGADVAGMHLYLEARDYALHHACTVHTKMKNDLCVAVIGALLMHA